LVWLPGDLAIDPHQRPLAASSLGLVAQGDPIRIGNYDLMDHDGGLYKIDAEPLHAPPMNRG
jgi:hypothetical protein